jgi:hypothetical protein
MELSSKQTMDDQDYPAEERALPIRSLNHMCHEKIGTADRTYYLTLL